MHTTPTTPAVDVAMVRQIAEQLIAPLDEVASIRVSWALARSASCVESLFAIADELEACAELLQARPPQGPYRELAIPSDVARFTPGDFVTFDGTGQRTDVAGFLLDQVSWLRKNVLDAAAGSTLTRLALEQRQPADPRAALAQRLAELLTRLDTRSPSALVGIRLRLAELGTDCSR